MTSAPPLTIAVGSDHAGPALKALLADSLREAGHTVLDLGTDGPASVDYPDFAHAVCRAVEPSWEFGRHSPQCDKGRVAHGLRPLPPEDWTGAGGAGQA